MTSSNKATPQRLRSKPTPETQKEQNKTSDIPTSNSFS
jgi:hypothetical protein